MGEEILPAGAEVDMPAPEPAECRFRILVIVGAELTVLARETLVRHGFLFRFLQR